MLTIKCIRTKLDDTTETNIFSTLQCTKTEHLDGSTELDFRSGNDAMKWVVDNPENEKEQGYIKHVCYIENMSGKTIDRVFSDREV